MRWVRLRLRVSLGHDDRGLIMTEAAWLDGFLAVQARLPLRCLDLRSVVNEGRIPLMPEVPGAGPWQAT